MRKVRSTPCRTSQPNGHDAGASPPAQRDPARSSSVMGTDGGATDGQLARASVTDQGAPARNGDAAHHRQRTNGSAAPDGLRVAPEKDRLLDSAGPSALAVQNESQPPDKSTLAIAEPRRVRRPEHLRFVASRSCLICGRSPCEAHHLTFAQPRALALKSSDEYCVPLCRAHHRQLHAGGDEEAWWRERSIDALEVAEDLWEESRSAAPSRRPAQNGT